ncbi:MULTISPECIES: hypothetical protein [unclassified Nitrospina]|uniref:hypothetical protein n=1 Tax=unclassified Nitrospina TaxID=2638683 RepID=UPI003F99CFBE
MNAATARKVKVFVMVTALLCLAVSPLYADPKSSETDPTPECQEMASSKMDHPESGSTCEPVADLESKGVEDPSDAKPGAGEESGQKNETPRKPLPQCSDPLFAEANPALCF